MNIKKVTNISIYGGCTQILPNAVSGKQNIHDCKFMGGLKKTFGESGVLPCYSGYSSLGS